MGRHTRCLCNTRNQCLTLKCPVIKVRDNSFGFVWFWGGGGGNRDLLFDLLIVAAFLSFPGCSTVSEYPGLYIKDCQTMRSLMC